MGEIEFKKEELYDSIQFNINEDNENFSIIISIFGYHISSIQKYCLSN